MADTTTTRVIFGHFNYHDLVIKDGCITIIQPALIALDNSNRVSFSAYVHTRNNEGNIRRHIHQMDCADTNVCHTPRPPGEEDPHQPEPRHQVACLTCHNINLCTRPERPIDCKFWGPGGWRYLELVMQEIPNVSEVWNTFEANPVARHIVNTLTYTLPARKCRDNLAKYMAPDEDNNNKSEEAQKCDQRPDKEMKGNMIKWLHSLHDSVNCRNNKPNKPTLEEVKKKGLLLSCPRAVSRMTSWTGGGVYAAVYDKNKVSERHRLTDFEPCILLLPLADAAKIRAFKYAMMITQNSNSAKQWNMLDTLSRHLEKMFQNTDFHILRFSSLQSDCVVLGCEVQGGHITDFHVIQYCCKTDHIIHHTRPCVFQETANDMTTLTMVQLPRLKFFEHTFSVSKNVPTGSAGEEEVYEKCLEIRWDVAGLQGTPSVVFAKFVNNTVLTQEIWSETPIWALAHYVAQVRHDESLLNFLCNNNSNSTDLNLTSSSVARMDWLRHVGAIVVGNAAPAMFSHGRMEFTNCYLFAQRMFDTIVPNTVTEAEELFHHRRETSTNTDDDDVSKYLTQVWSCTRIRTPFFDNKETSSSGDILSIILGEEESEQCNCSRTRWNERSGFGAKNLLFSTIAHIAFLNTDWPIYDGDTLAQALQNTTPRPIGTYEYSRRERHDIAENSLREIDNKAQEWKSAKTRFQVSMETAKNKATGMCNQTDTNEHKKYLNGRPFQHIAIYDASHMNFKCQSNKDQHLRAGFIDKLVRENIELMVHMFNKEIAEVVLGSNFWSQDDDQMVFKRNDKWIYNLVSGRGGEQVPQSMSFHIVEDWHCGNLLLHNAQTKRLHLINLHHLALKICEQVDGIMAAEMQMQGSDEEDVITYKCASWLGFYLAHCAFMQGESYHAMPTRVEATTLDRMDTTDEGQPHLADDPILQRFQGEEEEEQADPMLDTDGE